jgi:membrane protein implicated in regulation of membrane protease activity
MAELISWVATIATITAAFMTAANLGARITGFGFAVFLIGSLSWLAIGLLTGQPALTGTNAVLTALNIFGVWRWLGRQASVEEGGRAAAEASAETPGEALFPVSQLGRAEVVGANGPLGHCIDALAGCRSGRIAYVVVSEGGVAGVGETLRRLPWPQAHVEDDRVVAELGRDEFADLQELQRDQWPAR